MLPHKAANRIRFAATRLPGTIDNFQDSALGTELPLNHTLTESSVSLLHPLSVYVSGPAPSPVTVIRKEKTSRNSVSLSWQEPDRPNGIILDYEIKYYEKEEQETSYTILRARGCNVTLNGLKPNTAYLLQIRARTAAGYGASSPSFQLETSPDSAFSISSENSQVVLIAISCAVAIILLTVLLYVLIGRSVPNQSYTV
ncbi:Ephrin type-A receptor 3 [Xenotaenia resolanae]|uniref:Ephrin type-A receptor 3 n=1 Tax=Xenotaenia resolanae TaxID=208358 RepID=A0ABV0X0D4_9TELE